MPEVFPFKVAGAPEPAEGPMFLADVDDLADGLGRSIVQDRWAGEFQLRAAFLRPLPATDPGEDGRRLVWTSSRP